MFFLYWVIVCVIFVTRMKTKLKFIPFRSHELKLNYLQSLELNCSKIKNKSEENKN